MADFKHEVYNLTKAISQTKIKEEFDSIIPAFCIDGGEKSVYSQFGLAKGYQFLSFFITERYKDEVYEKSKMIIPLLDETEKKCLGRCHSFIKYLNKELCREIVLKHKELEKIVNPYSNITVIPKEEEIEDIKNEVDIKLLMESFKQTNAYKNIINFESVDVDKIPAKQFLDFFTLINKEVKELEIEKNVSKDTENIIMQVNNPSNKGLIKFMFSVASIRYMMMYMNQLIFQKFMSNKLIMIDENNLITYTSHNNFLGSGFVAITQPSPVELFIEPGDLILFSGLKEKIQLCEIESITISFNQQDGNTMTYKLRNINNELNPLYEIIR